MISGKELRIVSLLALDSVFFLLEIIIGYMSHSLALIADSFHMLNDIFSLLVALWAVNVAKNRNPDAKYTYGWKRAEILGALINAVFLIALCFSIFIEALQRLLQPQEIENPKLVLYVGCAGLVSNFVGLFLFHDHDHEHGHDLESLENGSHTHSHLQRQEQSLDEEDPLTEMNGNRGGSGSESPNMLPEHLVNRMSVTEEELRKQSPKKQSESNKSLNMRGVFLHVMGDALGNLGVIAAALFIWKTDYSWRFYSDPVVSLVITVIIFSSALPLSRKASRILLQATPNTISAEAVEQEILNVPGVKAVHEFHIWNLNETITIASIHVEVDVTPDNFMNSAKLIRNIFHEHGIHSATVQPEFISGTISPDIQRRFSLIAGGLNDYTRPDTPSSSNSNVSASYGSTTCQNNNLS
ncbi:Zn(2+) transporter ZRC1 NDAI_0K00780 [Naumovozyma dairenensis CBS 421]|uniref:Uncharacterized protein n=1 Tax=Naumovozyma dairenensis (strain ATCC 10597 / BCRC 20456 / CBS 421 / NBRC 0211 / NRRL Y-12639) TaxID=1071378 RepID=G0WHK8_NAUDC|nr:hypothetical protein NDAI_0K00780 [Naumovozyma dairenensis CBS 421]CCD27269.1 hypothetical protein NDAI_0K00780 [Naumovozyma dairenensis CBS 421]